jgi:hypothetical protein
MRSLKVNDLLGLVLIKFCVCPLLTWFAPKPLQIISEATILPKSTLANIEGVDSKMLSAESKKQAYFFDYTQTVPGQPKTHFRTIFSFASAVVGGAGNLLVSITAQTPESDYESLKPLFDEIIDSYK